MSDMTAQKELAALIQVKIEPSDETGLYFATSPNMRGLLVAEKSLEALEAAIPRAIQDLYLASGVEVYVAKADVPGQDLMPWVAFPAALAHCQA